MNNYNDIKLSFMDFILKNYFLYKVINFVIFSVTYFYEILII